MEVVQLGGVVLCARMGEADGGSGVVTSSVNGKNLSMIDNLYD